MPKEMRDRIDAFKHQDGTTTTPVYEHDGWLLVAD